LICRCGHGDLAHTSAGRCVLCSCAHFFDRTVTQPAQSAIAGRAWMIRADPEIRPYIWQRGAIGVSWDIQVEVPHISDAEEMFAFFQSQPNLVHEPDRRLRTTSREMFEFIHKVKIGDIILTPLGSKIYVGKIIGTYEFRPSYLPKAGDPVGHAHIRPVEWLREVLRHDLSSSAQETLTFRQTIREASVHLHEITQLLD
jgi:predicted Mrr-cat superfamily restriction endonuclease